MRLRHKRKFYIRTVSGNLDSYAPVAVIIDRESCFLLAVSYGARVRKELLIGIVYRQVAAL
jgi:hypothetical protein